MGKLKKAERMIKNKKSNRKSVIVASVTAIFLMLLFGIMYRIMYARLSAPVETPLISADALEKLPMQIGDWTGQDAPLDENIVRATDTDAHVSRSYSRFSDSERVWLYISYGMRARDLMPHRPEVCYTGNGWTLINRHSVELPLSDGMKLKCNTFEFSRGTLNKEKIAVLDYYIVDGQYSRDVSLLRSKVWRGSGAVGYVAQVQIVASIRASLTKDAVSNMISSFAVESALPISRLFESIEESENSVSNNSHAESIYGVAGNE
jgi:EpsI family protein